MKKFIPISTFHKLFKSYSDLLSYDGLSVFIDRLKSSEGENISASLGLKPSELMYFIETVSKTENVLFYGWIEQNSNLFKFLTENKITFYEDKEGHLQHQLGASFQKFLSPFLSNQLIKHQGERELGKLEKLFSFVQLLDVEHRSVIENNLLESLMPEVKSVISNASSITDEQELIQVVKPMMDDRILTIVNSMSKASYGFKVDYVDDCLSVLKMQSCTPRFANWVLKRLEEIEMNKEHEHKVLDLRGELIAGNLAVKNHGKRKINFRFRNVAMFVFTITAVGLIGYLVFYKPFSRVEDVLFTNDTSFMQFSKEERLTIDSLLLAMKGQKAEDELRIDQGISLIGESDELTIRKSFENPILERTYKDLIMDAEYREDLYQDSCNTDVLFKPIPGSSDLKSRNANIETMIKNESEYDAIIVVSENTSKGSTFSMIILEGETKKIEINRYDLLKIVPGNNLQNYNPIIQDEGLPSKHFIQHFCKIDFNYKEGVTTDYQMVNLFEGRNKLLLMGDIGGSFKVIDINGAFATQ
jgi:hypothetical protein